MYYLFYCLNIDNNNKKTRKQMWMQNLMQTFRYAAQNVSRCSEYQMYLIS